MVNLSDLIEVDLTTRLARVQAQTLITRIIGENSGLVSFTTHARREMTNDDMDSADILNILRAGRIHEEGEFERGSWRYRVHTERFCVVVAFRNPHQLVVVTAWRKER